MGKKDNSNIKTNPLNIDEIYKKSFKKNFTKNGILLVKKVSRHTTLPNSINSLKQSVIERSKS